MLSRLVMACVLAVTALMTGPAPAIGEWYIAGQVGPTFADRLDNIGNTGLAAAPNLSPAAAAFDLSNSIAYGAKLGYFPGHGWFGLEGEVFNTTPHIKQLGPEPGLHLRVTTLGINFIGRYPGETVQPYVGIGMGITFSRLSDSPHANIRGDSDTSSGLNLLAGIRVFLSPYVSLFTEYKYLQSSLLFDQAYGPNAGFIGDYKAQHLMLGMAYHF